MDVHRGARRMVERTGASKSKLEQIEVLVTDSEPRMGNVLEESLKESERRYRLLAENVTDVIWTADMKLNPTYVSPSVTRMLGYSVEEVMAKTMEEILTPASFDLAMKTFTTELSIESAEQKGPLRSRTLELELNSKDGSTVVAEMRMSFLRGLGGRPVGILGIARDITERKRAGEELKESEAKYREIASNIPGVVYQFTLSKDGSTSFPFISEVCNAVFGLTPEEIKSDPSLPFRMIVADDFDRINQLFAESVEAMENGTAEFRIKTRTGEAKWLRVSSSPHLLPDGSILWDGIILDITERKRAEEELIRLSNAVRMAYDSIVISDLEVNIIEVNEATLKMYGTDYKGDLVGENALYLIAPEDREKALASLEEVLERGYSESQEYHIITKDGGRILVEMSTSIVKGADGKPTGLVAVSRDITERKRAEEDKEGITAQLLQAQKMEAIGALAGGIAHDFNNLITAIQGYADIAMTEVDETEPLYRNLKGIDAACSRAAKLTRQLLLFSRKNPLEVTPLDINELVEDLIKMLKRLIGEHIAINTDLEPDILTVRTDAGNIEQVLMNLAVNARDAMPEGGKLTVTTENVTLSIEQCKTIPEARPGRYVCLSVADTGVGMDKEIIPYIFDPFFTTKDPGEGTGLGLSVVYGIAKQHEGWINVYSEPGQGSTFKLYLPAVLGKPEAKTKETIPAEELQGNGKRILLIEDEDRVRDFLVEVLSKHGHVVFEAASAREALDIFDSKKGDFHLVFSDVILPDMSGFQLVDQILSRKPELPVLMGSGYANSKLQCPIMYEKEFQLLQKPYTLAELLQAVREAMGACL